MSAQAEAAPPTRSLITVKAALRLPALRRGAPEVLAGHDRLDRRIRWVHVAEVPNIAALLKGGEMLLSTGMGTGKTAAQQRRFIDALYERGVSALVIELGQHLQRVPAVLIKQAETRDLPLIALHREIAFIEVTEAIHSNIVSRQFAALRRGEDIHRRFTELMIEGAGIPEILAALAQTIANPVLLEQAGHGVVYHATHRAGAAEVLAAWDTLQSEPTGDPHIGDAAAVVGDPDIGDAAVVVGDPDIGDAAVVVPVPASGGSTWGRLVALAIDSPIDEFARVASERAVALVALTLLRRYQEELLAARERGNFLSALAAGQLHPADAAHRAETLGFQQRRRTHLLPLAIAIPTLTATQAAGAQEIAWTPVWQAFLDEMHSRAIPALLGTRASHRDALAILGLTRPDRRQEVIELAATTIHDAAERHLKSADFPVIAVGRLVTSWREAPAVLSETADTAALARGAPSRPWHDAATPDIDRLLSSLRDNQHLRTFVERRLQPLLEHDDRRAAKLLPTLEALLEHDGRKAQTARALHLERQSLYHRINRIQAVLGCDLEDPGTRLGLHLAVRARHHLQHD